MRRLLLWTFTNRETGAITVAQMPNTTLWVVIAAAVAQASFAWGDRLGAVLTIVVKGGLCLWALDELLRGVNPWRRCLGAAVLVYELTTLRS